MVFPRNLETKPEIEVDPQEPRRAADGGFVEKPSTGLLGRSHNLLLAMGSRGKHG